METPSSLHPIAHRVVVVVVAAVVVVVAGACADGDGGDLAMGAYSIVDADRPASHEQAVHSVCGSGSTVKGIDVSKWQGTINWSSVANDGVKFAFIRVSDGTGYIDGKFASNWSGAKSHGIIRGAYQFFRSNQDPIAQADLLLEKMGDLEAGDLPPVVDVESTDGVSNATRASKLHQWLDHVEAATGVKPIIYTGGYFWDDHVGADFSAYPLWHAGYTGGTCPSTISSKWSKWTIWQWTSSGSVSGIAGNVDMDKFNGTLSQLQELGAVTCVPATETCNGADDNCDGVVDDGDVCVPRDEALFGAAFFDGGNSVHDVDGDGVADVCARAAAGIVCSLSGGGGGGVVDDATGAIGPAVNANGSAGPLSTPVSTTIFPNDSGWDDIGNYATIRLGDIDGDGRADLCARANAGMVCKLANVDGTGFGAGDGASFAGPALADEHGWNKPEYYGTVRVVDVDNDGRADICARAAVGFGCYLSTGTGFSDARIAGTPEFFSNDEGFTDPSAYGTIRMADVDGDGRLDACARGGDGVECHRFQEDGTWSQALVGPAWSDAAGFSDVRYWSTFRFADLDGDRRADVCIRASDGIHCRLSEGDAFGDDILGPALSDDSGWGDLDNAATIRFADINGDGGADLCARANAGMRCWPFANGAFGEVVVGPDFFGDAGGFDAQEEFRTIRVADVNGDALADVCGRDAEGFTCFLASNAGGHTTFETRVDGPRWANAHGWAHLQYSGTFVMSGYWPVRGVRDGVGVAVAPPARKPDPGTGDDDNDPVATFDEAADVDGDGAIDPPHTAAGMSCASTSSPSTSSAVATWAVLGLVLCVTRRRAPAV